MEMDNKTWLINEIVASDMDAKAKAELVLMVRPLEEERLDVKEGDILKLTGSETAGIYTVICIKKPYAGEAKAVIYRHLRQQFDILEESFYTNPKYFEIVGHHEGGRMTWADG